MGVVEVDVVFGDSCYANLVEGSREECRKSVVEGYRFVARGIVYSDVYLVGS